MSVETIDEGLAALEWPHVASVQIIFNIFRQRPADRFLAEAAGHGLALRHLQRERGTLEEVYLALAAGVTAVPATPATPARESLDPHADAGATP